MKTRSFVVGCVLALATQAGFCATFQNLDFESARIPLEISDCYVSATTNILPGWRYYYGATELLTFAYRCASLEGFSGLVDSPSGGYRFPNFVEGKYAVYFQQDVVGNSPFAIAQTATIPFDAKFLRFKAAGYTGFTPTLNGDAPPLVDRILLGGVQNPPVFFPDLFAEITNGFRKTYDISAFAGKDVELRFTVGHIVGGGPFFTYGEGILDSIELLTDYARFYPSSVNLDTNGFTLSWVSIPSSKFQVESATNFPAIWQPIGPPVTSTNNTFIFTDTAVTNQPSSQRFYRLRALP
jgi:hypothetical protein